MGWAGSVLGAANNMSATAGDAVKGATGRLGGAVLGDENAAAFQNGLRGDGEVLSVDKDGKVEVGKTLSGAAGMLIGNRIDSTFDLSETGTRYQRNMEAQKKAMTLANEYAKQSMKNATGGGVNE